MPGLIDATKGLKALEEPCQCEHEHEADHGHDHGHESRNPHLFASPVTAMGMVENIARELEKMDPANAALYRANAKTYLEKLNGLKKQIEELAPLVKGRAIVAQHDIFDYLAEALGLKVVTTISDGKTAPSASEMKELVHQIRETKASVIFTEPQYPARTAQTLAKECGIRNRQAGSGCGRAGGCRRRHL